MKTTLALLLAFTAYVGATPVPQSDDEPGVPCPVNGILTTVAEGETPMLEDIATANGIVLADLIAGNPDIDTTLNLPSGTDICNVPAVEEPASSTEDETAATTVDETATSTAAETGETPGNYGGEGNSPRVATTTCTGTEFEVLLEDDTLAGIAELNGVELASILAANTHLGTDENGPLYVGEMVCFPTTCYPGREIELLPENEVKDQCEEVFIVVDGDTLESIAAANNLDLATLIAANPQIGNPDLIFPGDKICKPAGCPGYGYTEFQEADEAYGDGGNGGEDEATETETSTVETATESTTDEADDDDDLETEEQEDQAQTLQSSAHSLTVSVFLGVATLFVAFL
jgi:LysM repeat protein